MVKTPRTRHSRTEKEPVTIDLAPDEVSRMAAEGEPDTGEKAEPEQAEAVTTESETVGAVSLEQQDQAEAANPAKDQMKPAPERPASLAPSGRGGGGLIAGLVGGVAALALAAGLQYAGVLPQQNAGPAATDPAAIDHGPAIAALETQLGELRQQITALNGVDRDDANLAGRLGDAEAQMTALASGLESLRGEVAALDATAPGEAASVDLAPVEEKIAGLEEALARLPDTSATEAAIAALQGEVGTIRDAEQQAAPRLAALEAAIKSLTDRVDEQEQAPATAIIIAASSLKAAIDRGTSFVTELDTYAALVPDAPQLAELHALAAAGVPTRAQLAASSDAAATAMIAAARPVDPQASITDRLWSSMMGLVQVRPIGMVEGDGVPEIVARLDAAVQAGDYQRALAEYDALPPEAKAAGEGFIARLRARQTADQLVDEALAAALKA